jgi:hypothetical protein
MVKLEFAEQRVHINKDLLNKLLASQKDFKVLYCEDHDGAHWDIETEDAQSILFWADNGPDA